MVSTTKILSHYIGQQKIYVTLYITGLCALEYGLFAAPFVFKTEMLFLLPISRILIFAALPYRSVFNLVLII